MPRFLKIEIENMIKPLKNDKHFLMVDLVIDGIKIDTGEEPMSSHYFWLEMRNATNKALHRIEEGNPKMNFNFNFANLGKTKEEINTGFVSHLKQKYSSVDTDKVLGIIEEKFKDLKMVGDPVEHPNPNLYFPLDSHMTKAFIFSVIEELNK